MSVALSYMNTSFATTMRGNDARHLNKGSYKRLEIRFGRATINGNMTETKRGMGGRDIKKNDAMTDKTQVFKQEHRNTATQEPQEHYNTAAHSTQHTHIPQKTQNTQKTQKRTLPHHPRP